MNRLVKEQKENTTNQGILLSHTTMHPKQPLTKLEGGKLNDVAVSLNYSTKPHMARGPNRLITLENMQGIGHSGPKKGTGLKI